MGATAGQTATVRSADGTVIAVDRRGNGPGLVIVGGALSERSAAAPLAECLARDFTAVAYDRRGRGDSGDTPPYSVDREIEDLAAVVESLDGPVSVYGHSSGGVLALRAVVAGLPLSALVLYEPPLVAAGTPRRMAADLDSRLETALDGEDGRDAAVRMFLREGPGVPEPAIDAMASSPAWGPLLALAHTAPYDATIVGDGGIPDEMRTIRTPVLVFQGGASPDWMLDGTRELANVLPAGRLVTLDELDHSGARTDPERVAGEMTRFLAGV